MVKREVLASRLSRERGESSARIILARNFNPPLASLSLHGRRAFPRGRETDKKLRNGKQRILARLSGKSCGVYARDCPFVYSGSRRGLRPSSCRAPFGESNDPERAFVRSFFDFVSDRPSMEISERNLDGERPSKRKEKYNEGILHRRRIKNTSAVRSL